MKIRNKKTGEIVEDSDLGKMLSQYEMPSFESISDLCEEWSPICLIQECIIDTRK